jgi:sulfoxide reductase heme-binding subunit YedZ
MRGWPVTIGISLVLLALAALQLTIWGTDEAGVRVVVRSTARSSVVLFLLAFCASSLRMFWQTGVSKWLLAQRRYVGVSYAVSHAIHAAALVALYMISTEFSTTLSAVTIVFGGLAYVFTLAMAFTSFDAAVHALGRDRWHRLHVIGGWYIWLIFAQSYVPRAFASVAYVPVALLVLAVPVIRIARARRSRSKPTRGRAPHMEAASGGRSGARP